MLVGKRGNTDMICYNCGANLTEHDFCTNCGADVAKYKKIMSAANLYYNEGLEKATVRDLSGAIISLRQCLKLNKNHVEARNLLGLVYFEMGEPVAALSEWVISKNLRPAKNIADDYLDMIQNNPSRLDAISQTIKKYNQALAYCYQGSLDLAIIQLKKVLSLNPKFVKAHQLLALLYLNGEQWETAEKELGKCQKIDVNNTITLRYLKEVHAVLNLDDNGTSNNAKKKNGNEESVKYRHGNETIIQPLNNRDNKSINILINIGVGIIIGIAVACFLILPARIQLAKQGIDDNLKAVSEQLDIKTAKIAELEQNIKTLTSEKENMSTQLEAYTGKDGAMTAVESLLGAANIYLTEPTDTKKVAEYLDKIDEDTLKNSSDTFMEVYEYLLSKVGSSVGKSYYDEGMESYQNENYTEAIKNLTKAYNYDNTNGDALFNLGNAYRKAMDTKNALKVYKKVIELFPNTEKANRSQSYINELNGSN